MITLVNGRETDQVSVADRGFQYGDGLFETIAVYHATPLLWPGHMQRLRDGCARLQLDMPDEDVLLQEVIQVVGEAERAVVKITVTHGPAGRGEVSEHGADPGVCDGGFDRIGERYR